MEEIGKLSGDVTAAQAGVALAPLLPKVLRELPGAVTEFVAVCCIPDHELKMMYGTPNVIKEEVERISTEIMFESKPDELLAAFGKFLGCLEVNALKNELAQVVTTFNDLMSQPQMQAPG
jgi:hypothetical protein